MRRLWFFGLCALSCNREPPPTAPPSATPVAPSTPWVPTAAPSASAALSDAGADATLPRARPKRPTPELAGKVVRFEGGKSPSVAVASTAGEVSLRGVDGKALDWRVGDEIVVHGPKPAGGAVDCTEPERCSIGLGSGGDVALFGSDAHAALRLLGRFGQNAMLTGRGHEAWVELRATNKDVLARSFAAAFGLGTKRYKSLALFAPPAFLAALSVPHVPVPGRKVDLDLSGASLQNLNGLFADISRASLSGELRGEVSTIARNVDSGEALDALYALCGIQFARKGPGIALTQTGTACTDRVAPPRHCPPPSSPPLLAVESLLACVDVNELEVKALAFPPGPDSEPIALLGQGPSRGDEMPVRRGIYLAQSEKGERYELHWMVQAIRRDGVDLVLEDPSNASIVPKRLTLPVPR